MCFAVKRNWRHKVVQCWTNADSWCKSKMKIVAGELAKHCQCHDWRCNGDMQFRAWGHSMQSDEGDEDEETDWSQALIHDWRWWWYREKKRQERICGEYLFFWVFCDSFLVCLKSELPPLFSIMSLLYLFQNFVRGLVRGYKFSWNSVRVSYMLLV